MGVPGGEHGNVQTGGGDRVNTISLLGCSTSVALATVPTDEEDNIFKGIFRVATFREILPDNPLLPEPVLTL